MIRRLFIECLLLAGITLYTVGQNTGRITESSLGISFKNIGTVQMIDSTSYSIRLSPEKNTSASPVYVYVSTSEKPYVDLPGSYGGKLFLDGTTPAKLLQNRVFVDSILIDNKSFRREYWTVYAGMGMWEGVIQCSRFENGRYYMVSMVQDTPLGKPGESRNGKVITSEEIKAMYLKTLSDTSDVMVQKFTTLLGSIQFLQK